MIHTDILSNIKAWAKYIDSRPHLEVLDDLSIKPDLSFSSLRQLIRSLARQGVLYDPHAVFLLDWDNTCRVQRHSNLFTLRLGEITPSELHILEELQAHVCKLLIVTNQIDSDHWLADLLGGMNGYEAYPRALRDRAIPYVGAPNRIPGITAPFKDTPESVDATINALDALMPLAKYTHLYAVGDQASDMIFADKLYKKLQSIKGFQARIHPYLLQPEGREKSTDREQAPSLFPMPLRS